MKHSLLESCSDEQLMEQIKTGSYSAFNELFKRSWSPLFVSAYKVLGEREACYDVCQEVFVWLWENRETVHIRGSVKGYLYTAVKYKVANYIRRNKVRDSFFEQLRTVPEGYSLEETVELKELQSYIRDFSDRLPERCGEIFKLSRLEFFSNKEIAAKLNISVRTVENQIAIALKKLKKSLGNLSRFTLFL